jgi:prepilin-type N-terminal cleavage/methylation domain-containing protein
VRLRELNGVDNVDSTPIAGGTLIMENHTEVQADKHDKGFTLVELLIVIVILGILATVTVFAVRGITDQGKTSTCKADSKTLQTAYEAFQAQYGGGNIPIAPAAVPAGANAAYVTAGNGTTAELTLKNAGFLRSDSPNWTMAVNGTLTVEDNDAVTAGVQSTNGCTTAMI